MELWQLSVTELTDAYKHGKVSPLEVIEMSLRRIGRLDPAIGGFREVFHERAINEARARSDELARGEWAGPLHGIPVAIKELFDVEGAVGCYGSTILLDRIAPSDAAAVARWREAGAIVIGVTRSHEFGWGITTQHAELGSTLNPWNTDRVPGGSSGGVGCGARSRHGAPGTRKRHRRFHPDSGLFSAGSQGSNRPTAGLPSAAPRRSLRPSTTRGPLARNGSGSGDRSGRHGRVRRFGPQHPARPTPLRGRWTPSVAGVRVGLVADLHPRALREDHQARFDAATEAMSDAGARLIDLSFPGAEEIRPTFATIQMAEAHHVHSSVMGIFPRRASEYGADVRGRLEMSADITLADYLSALEAKRALRHRFARLFDEVDVMMTPITAGGPSTTSEPDVSFDGTGEAPFRDVVMDYTVAQDLFGLPVCAVPNGLDGDGLPLGLQLTGPTLSENAVMGCCGRNRNGPAESRVSADSRLVAYGR